MAVNVIVAPASVTTGAASAQFTGTFAVGRYEAVATVAAWLCVGANPTAVAAAAGNIYLPAGIPRVFYIDQPASKIAVIQDAAPGKVNVCICE